MNEHQFEGGFNMAGTLDYFQSMIHKAVMDRPTTGFRYVEIGVAEGTTLKSAANMLRGILSSSLYQVIGIDLFDGAFFNEREFLRKACTFNVALRYNGKGISPVVPDEINSEVSVLLLKGDAQRVRFMPDTINFALIDGCHGAPCVEKDFLSIEPGMAMGGIVAFHDAGIEDQGIHFQQHCQQPISVRKALNNLSLLTEHKLLMAVPPNVPETQGACFREGWRFIGHIDGDKSPGNLQLNGHGFVFFQRVKGAQ